MSKNRDIGVMARMLIRSNSVSGIERNCTRRHDSPSRKHEFRGTRFTLVVFPRELSVRHHHQQRRLEPADQVPEPKTARRDQAQQTGPDRSQIKVMEAQATEKHGQQHRHEF